MIVYICGPATGYPDFNIQAFRAADKFLTHLGFETINPLDQDDESPDPEGKCDGERWLKYIIRDIRLLAKADAIYCLPKVDESFGASIELLVARRLKKLIMHHADWSYIHEEE